MDAPQDYYELLQISPNAEPETIHRVYRMLAMRFHPDNTATGNEKRFRQLLEAYQVLSDPERRAQYDVFCQQQRTASWPVAPTDAEAENDFAREEFVRMAVLEVLYTKRRLEPTKPGFYIVELEKITGRPREHLEFTVWFLLQKKFLQRADNSSLVITADGVEFFEEHHQRNGNPHAKRLRAQND